MWSGYQVRDLLPDAELCVYVCVELPIHFFIIEWICTDDQNNDNNEVAGRKHFISLHEHLLKGFRLPVAAAKCIHMRVCMYPSLFLLQYCSCILDFSGENI